MFDRPEMSNLVIRMLSVMAEVISLKPESPIRLSATFCKQTITPYCVTCELSYPNRNI